MAKPRSRVALFVSLIVAAVVLAIGAFGLAGQIALTTQSVQTTATVIGFEKKEECLRSCTTYYPATVQFTTTDGTQITTTVTQARNLDAPVAGSQVLIRYRQDQPEVAQRAEDIGFNWILPSFLTGAGLLVVVGNGILLWRRRE